MKLPSHATPSQPPEAFVDLRAECGPIRSQGRRGTCLSIALSDGHSQVRKHQVQLSVDYLHYHTHEIMRSKGDVLSINGGTYEQPACDALGLEGQPDEECCPYSAQSVDEEWRPPELPASAVVLRYTAVLGSIDDIRSSLSDKRACVIVLRVPVGFLNLTAVDCMYDVATPGHMRHALLVVGMDERGDWVLVRNSWGPNWGLHGHAWISTTAIFALLDTVILFGEPGELLDEVMPSAPHG